MDGIKDNLTFKGGTSLSKIYKVIDRFSEDIDISVERAYLGFKDDKDPANVGTKQAKRLIEELGEACQKFVRGDLFNLLERIINTKLGPNGWKLDIDEEDNDSQTILFTYPKITIKASEYIRPVVKIELGARSDHWPVSMQKISPYVAEDSGGIVGYYNKLEIASDPSRSEYEDTVNWLEYMMFKDTFDLTEINEFRISRRKVIV